MNVRITPNELAALARLVKTPDGALLLGILEREYAALQELLVTTNLDAIAIVQGQARGVREIKAVLVKAESASK